MGLIIIINNNNNWMKIIEKEAHLHTVDYDEDLDPTVVLSL